MILNDGQRDALAELANVGFGRAAGSLSVLTGEQIAVQAPLLKFTALDEVITQLADGLSGEVVCVNQPFSGPISGNGLLIMDSPGAIRLTAILGMEPSQLGTNAAVTETLTEVGNILLNACLGVFDNVLGVPVTFAVPLLSLETV